MKVEVLKPTEVKIHSVRIEVEFMKKTDIYYRDCLKLKQ